MKVNKIVAKTNIALCFAILENREFSYIKAYYPEQMKMEF